MLGGRHDGIAFAGAKAACPKSAILMGEGEQIR
jgi:hypothetical protein